jgi:hypothetical protein
MFRDLRQSISLFPNAPLDHVPSGGGPAGEAYRRVPAMSDLLHPGPKGYAIWAQAVKEPLTKLKAAR